MTQYAIDYKDTTPSQTRVTPPAANDDNYSDRGHVHGPSRGFALPNILKTASVFLTGAICLFGMEMYAPEHVRPSTFVGTYDARLAAAVKAAELQQQSRYEEWAAHVKVAAEQNAEQYKAITQGILGNYNATYEQAKIYAQATTEMQGRLTASLMSQKQSEQGSDIGIINMARLWGEVGSVFDEESARKARNYADNRSKELSVELIEAARLGVSTEISGWDVNIAKPQDVAASLAAIKPLEIPAAPSIGEQVVTIGGTR